MVQYLERVGAEIVPAVAFGDAAGLPFEAMSAAKIQEYYGTPDQLIPPERHKIYVGNFPAGTWSDDTQLTMVVAEALLEADGFDIDRLARGHVRAYGETPQITDEKGQKITRGWGKSTTRSVERIARGESPMVSGEKNGGGNGIVMKMAPLVYWQAARETVEDERYRQYDALTTMTHDSDLARIATRVHGDLLMRLMEAEGREVNLPEAVKQSVERHERVFATNYDHSRELAYLWSESEFTPEVILGATDGRGFKVSQTLAMAYGSFLGDHEDLHSAVFSAVRLGGDTDSIASIVAAMTVCAHDKELVRYEDVEQVLDIALITSLSRRLAHRALES